MRKILVTLCFLVSGAAFAGSEMPQGPICGEGVICKIPTPPKCGEGVICKL